jgi:hypothetical protein
MKLIGLAPALRLFASLSLQAYWREELSQCRVGRCDDRGATNFLAHVAS